MYQLDGGGAILQGREKVKATRRLPPSLRASMKSCSYYLSPSRFFLSALMLANTGNIDFSTTGDDNLGKAYLGQTNQDLYPSCTLGMDNVNLTLLSTARHHQQLEEFNPHRQLEGPRTRQPGPGQTRGRHRSRLRGRRKNVTKLPCFVLFRLLYKIPKKLSICWSIW